MVKKTKIEVVWDRPAYASFQLAFEYIKKDSIVNAERFRNEILKITKGLPDHPEKYPPDRFKKDNTGNYRAFEKYSYRIAYKAMAKEIIILRFCHVKQEPKEY